MGDLKRKNSALEERAPGTIVPLFWAAAVLVLFGWGVLRAFGADLTGGHSFSYGETVTADTMDSIVGSAVINSGFYTAKATQTTAAAADVVLLYSPSLGGFRQMTVANLLYTNSDLIGVLLSTSDFVRRSNFLAGVDTTAISNFLAKADAGGVSNFLYAATDGARSNFLNGVTAAAQDNVVSNWLHNASTAALSNAVANFWTYAPTNLTDLAPTNNDYVLYYNTNAAAWRRTRIADLVGATRFQFTSAEFALPASSGVVADTAHGLPGIPQVVRWVAVCKTNENGWDAGDQLDLQTFFSNNYRVGAGTNNVWCLAPAGFATLTGMTRAGATGASFTAARWKAKCYATYYP